MKIKALENKRIDNYLSETLDISRSQIQKYIKENYITVNNQEVKSSYVLKETDEIEGNIKEEEKIISATPEKMDLNIVYEDDDVIVINKPNGMVVHPGNGNYSHTLANGLMYHSKLSDINGSFRPGIVHRIDAYTTGLLMVAKNNFAHASLAKQLEEKTVTRKYIALVWGIIKSDTGTIDAPIGRDKLDRKKMAVTDINSKKAITHFKVLERLNNATLIELSLETGRTHQIRVHMNYIGHPVVNDPVYGKRKLIDSTGQCLHAKVIGFNHPRTNKYLEFDSELPECFTNILNKFRDS